MTDTSSLAVVILAAGKGTRMKSAFPKVMHEIAGRPIISWLIGQTQSLNPEKIIVVIGPDMDALTQTVKPHEVAIQQDQKGTGDAVKAALPHLEGFKGKVLVLLGDEPFVCTDALREMISKDGISVLGVRPPSVKGLGRFVLNDDGTLGKIVEEKDCSREEKEIDLGNAGNFCIPSEKLAHWLGKISTDNVQGEYYLTDLPAIAAEEGVKTSVVEITVDHSWGINDRVQLAQHEQFAQKVLREKAMLGGATFLDPDTVYLSWDTALGEDTLVGQDVVFGPGVTVAANVTIHPFCHLEGVAIESGAQVGPFARVRPKSTIGENAVVGNFIEVNRSTLEAGAKSKHVSYIGDAVIGAKSNIGAGTVIANYDGFNKQETTIGKEVFVGSNATIVAPVTIGEGAIIAAGSTITDDVPANALGITRPDMRTEAGWAEGYRKRKKKKK